MAMRAMILDNHKTMFCEQCGTQNSDKAKFCRECGVEIAYETETKVAVREAGVPESSDAEAGIFSISPTLMFVKAGYAAAALAAVLTVAVVTAFSSVAAWVAVLFALLLFIVPAFYHFRQKLVRYTLTESKLEIDAGFIARTTRSVPLGRIQDVTVSASVVQRLLGFGNVTIDNASDDGGKLVLANINTPQNYADLLLKQMRRLDGDRR